MSHHAKCFSAVVVALSSDAACKFIELHTEWQRIEFMSFCTAATGTAYAVQPAQMAAIPGQPMHVQQAPQTIVGPAGGAAYFPLQYQHGMQVAVDVNGQQYIDPNQFYVAQTSGAAATAAYIPHGLQQQAVAIPSGPQVQVGPVATSTVGGGSRAVAIPTATVTPTLTPIPATAAVNANRDIVVTEAKNPPSVTTTASEVHSAGLKQSDVKAQEQVSACLILHSSEARSDIYV